MNEAKLCRECNRIRNIERFRKSRGREGGRMPSCMECTDSIKNGKEIQRHPGPEPLNEELETRVGTLEDTYKVPVTDQDYVERIMSDLEVLAKTWTADRLVMFAYYLLEEARRRKNKYLNQAV